MISGVQFSELSRDQLLGLELRELERNLTKDELEAIFKACDALWYHPGLEISPRAPHAILTTGKHSTGYINCPLVLSRSNLCRIMADQLLTLFQSRTYNGPVDWVIGSDSSALGLSKDMANFLKARWHPMQKGPNKSQVWEKITIPLGGKVLHVEELATTSATSVAVRKGIRDGNKHEVDFIPFIPILVFRPDAGTPDVIDGSKVIPLLRYSIYTVDPEEKECEFCRAGSKALPAKEHWDELVATI